MDILEKLEAKDKKKKGCWQKGFFCLFLIVLIVVVTVVFVFLGQKEPEVVDARFDELINRELVNVIDNRVDSKRAGLYEKLKQDVENFTVFFENDEFVVEYFLTNELNLRGDLALSNCELAVILEDTFGTLVYDFGEVSKLLYASDIYQYEFEKVQENVIRYEMILCVDGDSFKMLASNISKNLPDKFYLTVGGRVNIITGLVEDDVEIKVNELEGEDNEYCLDKIFASVGVSIEDREELVVIAEEFLKKQNLIWKTISFMGDNLLTLKEKG